MEVIERGITFLLGAQRQDGLWRDFVTLAGVGIDWPTGFVGEQLVIAGADPAPLELAAHALIARQHDDGGWGYHEGVPTDADSTACVLLFLQAIQKLGVDTGEGPERAAVCLERHQLPASGGVPTYREPEAIRRFMKLNQEADLSGWCSAHVDVTATSARALHSAAGIHHDSAAEMWRYVRARQFDNGCWRSYWWTSPHYATLQAATLAKDFSDHASLERAAKWALGEQLDGGGWSAPGAPVSALATALTLSILVKSGIADAAVDRAVECLSELQEIDGGWPIHPMMRIPPPYLIEPGNLQKWRPDGLGTGVVIRDQNRLFTTAACLAALTLARGGVP